MVLPATQNNGCADLYGDFFRLPSVQGSRRFEQPRAWTEAQRKQAQEVARDVLELGEYVAKNQLASPSQSQQAPQGFASRRAYRRAHYHYYSRTDRLIDILLIKELISPPYTSRNGDDRAFKIFIAVIGFVVAGVFASLLGNLIKSGEDVADLKALENQVNSISNQAFKTTLRDKIIQPLRNLITARREKDIEKVAFAAIGLVAGVMLVIGAVISSAACMTAGGLLLGGIGVAALFRLNYLASSRRVQKIENENAKNARLILAGIPLVKAELGLEPTAPANSAS